jgi:protein phosphatase
LGDSRIYLLRDGTIQQLTEDHSWVAEQVRRGLMSLEEAEQSPYRNVITRCLGGELEVEADITAVELRPGDRFLLCTDGLSGLLSDEELLRVAGAGSPSVAAWNLIDRANLLGGKDNITALILDIEAVGAYEELAAPAVRGADEPSAAYDGIDSGAVGKAPTQTGDPSTHRERSERPGFIRGLFGRSERGT